LSSGSGAQKERRLAGKKFLAAIRLHYNGRRSLTGGKAMEEPLDLEGKPR
jgi:hypothetical protein